MNELSSLVFEPLSLKAILINLGIGVLLGVTLKWHFERFGTTLGSRYELARSLPFLVLIVCLIISVVKSSLALSLGLVGALSIVRFRTPIKEPEELVYLFMSIAIGLGLGAGQTTLTIVATLFILTVVAFLRRSFNNRNISCLYITMSWKGDENDTIARELTERVAEESLDCDLKRLDHAEHGSTLALQVNFTNPDQVFSLMESLKKEHSNLSVSFIDQSRVPGI